MRIDGRDLTGGHPFALVRRWHKVKGVLAAAAMEGGVVVTPEGEMSFRAGDYIVTDDPPTHAWPVKRAVFLATYLPDAYLPDEPTP